MQQILNMTSTDRTIQMQSQILCVHKEFSHLYSWLEWTIINHNLLSFYEKHLGKK